MLTKIVYFAGRVLAAIIAMFALVAMVVLWFAAYPVMSLPGLLVMCMVLFGSVSAAVVVHELGHLLACLAVGAQVRSFQVGSGRAGIRFRVRGVRVALDWPGGGRVTYTGARSAWRRMVITLSGSLANLTVAGLALALSARAGSAPGYILGLGSGAIGLGSILPYQLRSGELSDGARLFRVRASLRVDIEGTLAAFRAGGDSARVRAGSIARLLLRSGRFTELLELHTGFGMPAGPQARLLTRALHAIEDSLLCIPGLDAGVIDEAASRVQWILGTYPFSELDTWDSGLPRPAVLHTLALARLRQGRHDEVEPLCTPGLAADFGPAARATLLATVALARRALGQPYQDLLDQALRIASDADLVAEAARLLSRAP